MPSHANSSSPPLHTLLNAQERVAPLARVFLRSLSQVIGPEALKLSSFSSLLEPVIKIAVEPKTKADNENMGLALNRLAKEDPSFRFSRDEETGQTTIEGMGELHLEIIVETRVQSGGQRRRASRRGCLPRGNHAVEYTHKKQSGGAGQFAKVKIAFEPLEDMDAADLAEHREGALG
jgi:translation elongation factor EF-G